MQAEETVYSMSIATAVETTINDYLMSMSKEKITNLHDFVLEQVEPILLKAVMKKYRYNQSKAAAVLGMSRGTFRAKLIRYFGDKYCGQRSDKILTE